MIKNYNTNYLSMDECGLPLETLLDEVAMLLTRKKQQIATAESCTGGLIGHTLTNISGSSQYYNRGVIAYSNQSKIDQLGVSKQDLDLYGAVSEPVAKAMAEGIRERAQVDIGLATTGIAGPTGGTKEKPVGLVYIGLAMGQTLVKKFQFTGNRYENKQNTLYQALLILYHHLKEQ